MARAGSLARSKRMIEARRAGGGAGTRARQLAASHAAATAQAARVAAAGGWAGARAAAGRRCAAAVNGSRSLGVVGGFVDVAVVLIGVEGAAARYGVDGKDLLLRLPARLARGHGAQSGGVLGVKGFRVCGVSGL